MQKKDNADVVGEGQFNRVLGLTTAVMLVAGIMIGSGVFKKIVPMAQTLPHEGYILLAWVIAGVVSLFGAFTYAGLAGMTTETGGVCKGMLRMKRKGVVQTKVIGYPLIPIIIILFCLALVINTIVIQTRASMLGLLLIGSGIPFYLYFRHKIRTDSRQARM